MRPAEFTPATIIEAGQALQSAGRNITGFAIRQKVGGGNPARLKQVWDEHVASQSVQQTEPVAELPLEVAEEVATVTKALTERLATLAVQLNDKAIKAADRRVAEVVRSAGDQRAQAERELADAAQTVEDLEAKLDDAFDQVESLGKKLDDIETIRRDQAVELANVKAKAEAADLAHREQQKNAEREAQRSASLIAKTEAAQVQANKEISAAREDAAKLRGQLEATQAQVAELMRVFKQSGDGASPAKKSPSAKQ